MVLASPHTPGDHIRPQTCPACQQPYAYRYHGPRDAIRVRGFACTAHGWTYVHKDAEHPTGVLPE